MSFNVAIVGATGAVGQEFLTVLAERKFPIRNLRLLASQRSAGKSAQFNGTTHTVQELTKDSFNDVKFAFFSAGGGVSREFAPAAVAAGAIVIDNTSAFRMKDGIPLVVPEVNPEQIQQAQRPDRESQLQHDHHERPGLAAAQGQSREADHRQHVSSGQRRGAWGLYELDAQQKSLAGGVAVTQEKFPHLIVNNLFSHNTKLAENGYNEEENKMVNETRKIFGDPRIMITATCIRVPVPRAHSESINLEFERPMSEQQVREILAKAPGVRIVDDRERNHFPMPWKRAGRTTFWSVGSVRTSAATTAGGSRCSSPAIRCAREPRPTRCRSPSG